MNSSIQINNGLHFMFQKEVIQVLERHEDDSIDEPLTIWIVCLTDLYLTDLTLVCICVCEMFTFTTAYWFSSAVKETQMGCQVLYSLFKLQ